MQSEVGPDDLVSFPTLDGIVQFNCFRLCCCVLIIIYFNDIKKIEIDTARNRQDPK